MLIIIQKNKLCDLGSKYSEHKYKYYVIINSNKQLIKMLFS